jgi:integrase
MRHHTDRSLRERTSLRLPAMIGLLCGLRLGEVLALRWSRIAGKVIEVRETIEQTKAHGIRFKATKTKAGRRDVTMPDELIEALRDYRRAQFELRLRLGLGRLPDDVLLFWMRRTAVRARSTPRRSNGAISPRRSACRT